MKKILSTIALTMGVAAYATPSIPHAPVAACAIATAEAEASPVKQITIFEQKVETAERTYVLLMNVVRDELAYTVAYPGLEGLHTDAGIDMEGTVIDRDGNPQNINASISLTTASTIEVPVDGESRNFNCNPLGM